MTVTQIQLRDDEASALKKLAKRTGKTEAELILQAVEDMLSNVPDATRRERLVQARGMWHDHDALPSAGELRREWDRKL